MDFNEVAAKVERVKELRVQRAAIEAEIKELTGELPYTVPVIGELICLRCGYGDTARGQPRWIVYEGKMPRACTRCHSVAWMRPPKSLNSRHPSDPPNPNWYQHRSKKAALADVRSAEPACATPALRRFDITPDREIRIAGLPPPPPPTRLSEVLRERATEEEPVEEVMLAHQMPDPRVPDEPAEPEISEEDRLCDCGQRPHVANCAVFEPPPVEEPDGQAAVSG